MNCKKCGKPMPNGARYCISCGAEHDSNGELLVKSAPIDYNGTIMINNMPQNSEQGSKIDYNKTVMANDMQQSAKIDYNKTMMAGDLPKGGSIDYNKTMMANDLPNNNQPSPQAAVNTGASVKPKKKGSPIIIAACLIVVVAGVGSFILPNLNKKKTNNGITNKENVSSSESASETTTETIFETTSGNVVEDFNPNPGYWSKDYEFYYVGETKQKNQWVDDFYLGSDGRKVRNKFIDDTYYVDANGKKVKNEWYKTQRKIGTGEVTVWYYLGPDGAKLKDTLTPDGYYVDKDGIYIAGDYDNLAGKPGLYTGN